MKDQRNHEHSSHTYVVKHKIEEYMKQIPTTVNILTIKQLVMNEFKINQAQFYYFFKKIKNQNISYQMLIKNLD
jgi:hypothetical protein